MDEQQLIKRILNGDQQAYTHIIKTYKNPLYATILRMTNDVSVAQDLTQEAFIKIYEQLPKFDQSGVFKSWLYRVAINHCIDKLRKKVHATEPYEQETPTNTNNPEIIFLKNEQSRELESMLAHLPEIERTIICMRYMNELTYDEIANTLQISVADVRNKLHRAKKKMRKNVQEGSYFYEMSNRG